MMTFLQQTTEILGQNAIKATLTSISSGLVVWGFPLPVFLQFVGISVAIFSAVISAIYLYALYTEKKRSNRKAEEQKDRELDLKEQELNGK